jgi:hypothetical protein
MCTEVDSLCGASYDQSGTERVPHRSGYMRLALGHAGVGRIDLAIPRLSQGQLPSGWLFDPRWCSERFLVQVVRSVLLVKFWSCRHVQRAGIGEGQGVRQGGCCFMQPAFGSGSLYLPLARRHQSALPGRRRGGGEPPQRLPPRSSGRCLAWRWSSTKTAPEGRPFCAVWWHGVLRGWKWYFPTFTGASSRPWPISFAGYPDRDGVPISCVIC